jgi:adenylate cyclase
LIVTNGSVASEVEHTYTRAWELAQHVGDTPQRFAVLWGLWMFYETRGALPKARQLGEELLAVAQQAQDPGLLLEAHRVLGDTCYFLGEFALARTHLAQAIALYAPHQSRAHAFLSGGDPGIYCRAFVALPLLMLGYPAQARASIRAALTLAQELAHPYSETIARYYAARLHQLCRDGHATQEQADAMIVLATVHGFPLWLAGGMILRGWALAEQGQGAAGIAQIHQGLAARRSTGEETPRPYYLALLAEAYGKVGQFDEGLHVLAEALTAVHTTGERFYEAELYRLQGAFLLAQEGTKPPATGKEHRGQAAAACFHYALTIARGQQAKWWELQAARCISRLSQQQGQPVEAQRLITDMDDWFPEG